MQLIDYVTGSIGKAAAKSQDVLELVGSDELNRIGCSRCGGRLPLNRAARGETLFAVRKPHRDIRGELLCGCVWGHDERIGLAYGRGGRCRGACAKGPEAYDCILHKIPS